MGRLDLVDTLTLAFDSRLWVDLQCASLRTEDDFSRRLRDGGSYVYCFVMFA